MNPNHIAQCQKRFWEERFMGDSKIRILDSIRAGQKTKAPPLPTNMELKRNAFSKPKIDDQSVLFAEEFLTSNGQFLYCEDLEDCANQLITLAVRKKWTNLYCWQEELCEVFEIMSFRSIKIDKNLDNADASITLADSLVAQTGTIVLTSNKNRDLSLSAFPPVQIVIAFSSQIVLDWAAALKVVEKNNSAKIPPIMHFMTGPYKKHSNKAPLVGPEELYLFLVDED